MQNDIPPCILIASSLLKMSAVPALAFSQFWLNFSKSCKKLQPFERNFIYFILKHHFRVLFFISVTPYESLDFLCEILTSRDKYKSVYHSNLVF